MKAVKEQGKDIPGMPNVAKLSMSMIVRLTRDLGLRISGPAGMLHAYDSDDKAALKHATGDPFAGGISEMALFAQAPPIYGGTDQVQRNIIGERVLGLPKEPNNDRVTPFSELPKNAEPGTRHGPSRDRGVVGVGRADRGATRCGGDRGRRRRRLPHR